MKTFDIRIATAKLAAPVLRLTGFRFDKTFRWAESGWKATVYKYCSTVTANLIADGVRIKNPGIDPQSPLGLYLAEMERRQRHHRIVTMLALIAVFVIAGLILSGCAEKPWPDVTTTGATVIYEGRWDATDRYANGTPMEYPGHLSYLTIRPAVTPPLACKAVPQANGDVELLPCDN